MIKVSAKYICLKAAQNCSKDGIQERLRKRDENIFVCFLCWTVLPESPDCDL